MVLCWTKNKIYSDNISEKQRDTAVEKSVGRLEETLTGKKRNRKNGGEKLMKQQGVAEKQFLLFEKSQGKQ